MWVLTSPDARKAHEFAFNTAHCASIFCRRYETLEFEDVELPSAERMLHGLGPRIMVEVMDHGACPSNTKGYSRRFLGTRPNISESHSEISTRVPFCIAGH